MAKEKKDWAAITAVAAILTLVVSIIAFRNHILSFLSSVGKFLMDILNIFPTILSFRIPLYSLFIIFLLVVLVSFIIRRYNRREFLKVRDNLLFKILQLQEIGEKSLTYEYTEILELGYGLKINNGKIPKEKESEFKNIISDLVINNLIKYEASTKDQGKLYKMTDKGLKYAKRKKWQVL